MPWISPGISDGIKHINARHNLACVTAGDLPAQGAGTKNDSTSHATASFLSFSLSCLLCTLMQSLINALKLLLSAQPTADRVDWPLNPSSQEADFQTQSSSVDSKVDVAVVTGPWLFP